MTRPEPTIYGNCEGWNFIVGKKPEANSPKIPIILSLRANNRNLIHNLSTILHWLALDNLWVICGSAVNNHNYRKISGIDQSDISENHENLDSF